MAHTNNLADNDAVIVAYGRSPVGRAGKGSLVNVRPDDLAAYVTDKVLQKVPELDRTTIDDVICGCGLPAGEQGFNLGRVISIMARLDVPGTTVNRYCSSSLQTSRMAYHAIKAGEGDAFVSVGVECVSRYAHGYADQPDAQNPRLLPGNTEEFPDIYITMGQTAENVADLKGITREEMDRYAVKSQTLAVKARDGGFFDREIVPVPLPGGGTMPRDDAGNACPLNDGAAAVVIVSGRKAKALGLQPLARIVATAVSSLEPEIMGLGPIEASRRALARARMTMDDIDIVEINEAFAAQVIPCARELGIDPLSDKLNPHGGAIALGHPFGMTGARILCTLLNGLATAGKTIGLETMCVGGGQGMAMIVERIA
ncbi:MAG: acetyl-CoA C-acyltransferase [Chloroflexi bacterium]|nr:MAG: acetyl-CoA C-acyltransferase [Chloroflexota bacterium]